MSDIVFNVPGNYAYRQNQRGLAAWMAEGGFPGEESGFEWSWTLPFGSPVVEPGDRVYAVYAGKLIGFAPLVRLDRQGRRPVLVRSGGAVSVTIDERVRPFNGFKYRWWEREHETPIDLLAAFPELRVLSRFVLAANRHRVA